MLMKGGGGINVCIKKVLMNKDSKCGAAGPL